MRYNAAHLNWLVLVLLIVATVFSHYWVWGLLFIFWAITGLRSTHGNLLLPVSRQSDPLLYWAVNVLWFIFGLWSTLFDLLWRFGIYTIFGLNVYPNL